VNDLNNRLCFLKMIEKEEFHSLTFSFLKSFLNIPFKHIGYNRLVTPDFILKGTFDDVVEFNATDEQNQKHKVFVHFYNIHPGITDINFEISSDNWRSIKQNAVRQGFTYSNCQHIHHICFFHFKFSDNKNGHSARLYQFEYQPHLLSFECYELPQFSFAKSPQDEKSIWLQVFKKGIVSIESVPATPFVEQIKKAYDTTTWDSESRTWLALNNLYRGEDRVKNIIQRYKEFGVELNQKFIKKPAKVVSLSWILLEKRIGSVPNKVALNDIDTSIFDDLFPNLAFDLFRRWSKNCQEKHPTLDLTIIDERLLIEDVKTQITESLFRLFNDEDYYQKNFSINYATNFILGHIEGLLSIHWYMEYVTKNKDDFKTLMVLKSLNLFLELEDVFCIRAEHIYQEVLKSKLNLANPTFDIEKLELRLKDGKSVETGISGNNAIQTVLENLTNEYIQKLTKIQAEDFKLNVEDFIEKSRVEQFVTRNYPLFVPSL
jgi:hypothetical protein